MLASPAAGSAHPQLGTLQPRKPALLSQGTSRIRVVGRHRQQCTPVRSQQQDAPDSKASARLRRHYSGLRKEAEVRLLLAAVTFAVQSPLLLSAWSGTL